MRKSTAMETDSIRGSADVFLILADHRGDDIEPLIGGQVEIDDPDDHPRRVAVPVGLRQGHELWVLPVARDDSSTTTGVPTTRIA
jgi:hypothetical protein